MRLPQALTHKFVELVPDEVGPGILYISIQYATAVHKCCCGCGLEVVTPLSPCDWRLIFDGKTVSLEPSIGNWGFACQSHYWITRNRVCWAEKWSGKRIDAARKYQKKIRKTASQINGVLENQSPQTEEPTKSHEEEGLWRKLKRKIKRS